jgi:hypothetical protein
MKVRKSNALRRQQIQVPCSKDWIAINLNLSVPLIIAYQDNNVGLIQIGTEQGGIEQA